MTRSEEIGSGITAVSIYGSVKDRSAPLGFAMAETFASARWLCWYARQWSA